MSLEPSSEEELNKTKVTWPKRNLPDKEVEGLVAVNRYDYMYRAWKVMWQALSTLGSLLIGYLMGAK